MHVRKVTFVNVSGEKKMEIVICKADIEGIMYTTRSVTLKDVDTELHNDG